VSAVLLTGDCREMLRTLEAGSVRTCITSPPYFGLRDYGTASWEGGDETCDHMVGRFTTTVSEKQASSQGSGTMQAKGTCPHCGAKRIDCQIGLEQTPDDYVNELVEVFREVWRVLSDDGTLWLNLGDSYAGGKGKSGQANPEAQAERASNGESINQAHHQVAGQGKTRPTDDRAMLREAGLKPKDLIGIPWRVAFALQADGWYLRSDIIWHKPNPMPESVTDRPTKSHEYLFLLTKSPRYYYDHVAVREPSVTGSWDAMPPIGGAKHVEGNENNTYSGNTPASDGLRNKRDVWTIATKPFKGAHFAVMPEALVEPCVLAGSAEGDTVLDPFTGSGTVGVVALKHRRNFVGTELNPEYVEIAEQRLNGVEPRML